MIVVKPGKAYLLLAAATVLFFLCYRPAVMEDRHPAISTYNYSMEDTSRENIGFASEKDPDSVRKGCHIHINLDRLTLYLYKDGEYLDSFPVSGGTPGTPSPLGNWKIVSKETWGEGFGGSWLGFNVPWGQYGIHGTDEPWFVGRSNSSKGCIRMKNSDAKELFRLVPYGASVTIVQEDRTFRIMKDGDIGSDVVEIQEALKKLGYYPWYVDGRFGKQLENGIRKFQKEHGLWSSGIVYKNVYDLILLKAGEYDEAGN